MSKLDSFIRRMTAQRDCLNHAASLITHVPGTVFELGLGNGRTYDHLRQLFPDRDVYVFDRVIADFTSCMPPENRLFFQSGKASPIYSMRLPGAIEGI